MEVTVCDFDIFSIEIRFNICRHKIQEVLDWSGNVFMSRFINDPRRIDSEVKGCQKVRGMRNLAFEVSSAYLEG